MQDWAGGKHATGVKAEVPEETAFLDWSRRKQVRSTQAERLSAALDKGVCTRPMMLRNRFLRGVQEEMIDEERSACRQRPGVTRGHLPLASFPYATPARIEWSRELHHESRLVQEQVNHSLDTAKTLRAAEALIRPLCAVPV